MRSSRLARIGTTLLLSAAVFVASGCSCARTAVSDGSVNSQLATGTASVNASATKGGSEATSSTPGTTPGKAVRPGSAGLSPSDAEAIDAELSAIERELERMSLPSDSDFGGIESGLQ